MTDSLDRLRAALADRYAVERELGRGGAAFVYPSVALRDNRSVALNVFFSPSLPPCSACLNHPDRTPSRSAADHHRNEELRA